MASDFWKERHAEFLTDAIRFADLKAERGYRDQI
jgi:hypothetical protein